MKELVVNCRYYQFWSCIVLIKGLLVSMLTHNTIHTSLRLVRRVFPYDNAEGYILLPTNMVCGKTQTFFRETNSMKT